MRGPKRPREPPASTRGFGDSRLGRFRPPECICGENAVADGAGERDGARVRSDRELRGGDATAGLAAVPFVRWRVRGRAVGMRGGGCLQAGVVHTRVVAARVCRRIHAGVVASMRHVIVAPGRVVRDVIGGRVHAAAMIGIFARGAVVVTGGGHARRDRHRHATDQRDRENEMQERPKPTHGGESRGARERAQSLRRATGRRTQQCSVGACFHPARRVKGAPQ